MSISAISSASSAANSYWANAAQNHLGQTVQDFQSIGAALQSGSITGAQAAFTAFQKDLPASSQSTAAQPFGKNTQANSDYQTLTGALQSGNLAGAQQAFASLQTDFQAAHQSHHHNSTLSRAESTISSLGSKVKNFAQSVFSSIA